MCGQIASQLARTHPKLFLDPEMRITVQKNKVTIIIYLLIVLVVAFPAINAISERQVYAHAPSQPPITAREAEPLTAATSSPTPGVVSLAQPTSSEAEPTEGTVEETTAPSATTTPNPESVRETEPTEATAQDQATDQREPPNTGVVPDDPAELATPTHSEPDEIDPDATPLASLTPIPTVPYEGPPSAQWKQWPVLPESLSSEMIAIYQRGIEAGNNEHAFSVLGDCQSIPDVFMGIYDQDPDFVGDLPEDLQETVIHFGGSFERYSPTVKDGTTEGALLWYGWNDNLAGLCEHGESPLDCELRVHKPTIVFMHTGTHWEARSRDYLIKIINKIKEANAIPVIVTKADNREKDGRVNQTLADLAAEYNLPVWNFWASVQHLPESGMEPGSDMYLSEAGLEVHRQGALEALDAIWRMAEGAE